MQFRNPSGHAARVVAAAALLAVTSGMALPAAPAGAVSRSPDGVWRVDGYGTVLSVERGRLQEYQTTAVSCLKGESAERSGGGSTSPRYLTDEGDAFTVRSGTRRDRASLRVDGSPNYRDLRRVPALPASCAREMPGGPVAAFDVLWQTFEENYPFFAAKGIDWEAVRDRHRPRIHAGTTDAELFAVFEEMLAPLHDAHVALLAGDTGTFARSRPGTVIPGQTLEDRMRTSRSVTSTAVRCGSSDRAGSDTPISRAARGTSASPRSAATRRPTPSPPTARSWTAHLTRSSRPRARRG